jgi:hypothetical protein
MSSILLLYKGTSTPNSTHFDPKYSEPRIYTGGIDITLWNQFSKLEQSTALSKDWYV